MTCRQTASEKTKMDIRYFLDTFQVTVPQMEQLIATALSHGGDYADLYTEGTMQTCISNTRHTTICCFGTVKSLLEAFT